MDLAHWHVRKLRPLTCEDVEAVACGLANGHRAHTHVEHKVGSATCHHNLVTAQAGRMGPPALGHGAFLRDEAACNVHLQVLVQD